MTGGTKALSLLAAYAFGEKRGLNEEIQKVRSMAIDMARQKSVVRRGYIVDLFRHHGCLDEFIDLHWPNGRTPDGQRLLRYYEQLRVRHQQQLAGGDELDEPDNQTEEELTQSFALESQLRDFLANNLQIIEPGLSLYVRDGLHGVEFPVDAGRIDVLAIDRSGKHVVIELKLSKGRSKALGQLLYYMGWVDQHLPNAPCRGVIVAEEITDELRTAVARVPGILLYRYTISMAVERAPVDNVVGA